MVCTEEVQSARTVRAHGCATSVVVSWCFSVSLRQLVEALSDSSFLRVVFDFQVSRSIATNNNSTVRLRATEGDLFQCAKLPRPVGLCLSQRQGLA